MERAEYNRHSRARVAETAKNASRHATPDAPERIDHRRRCTRHGSSDVLPRIARERVPTVPHVAKTRQKCATPERPLPVTATATSHSHQPLATALARPPP